LVNFPAAAAAERQSFFRFSSPRGPPFCDGCDALVFTFAFFGFRASLFDLI
jgi:hypothetical protein